MLYFLALAGTAKSVFKTGAFNRSAIPPFTILPGRFMRDGGYHSEIVSRLYPQREESFEPGGCAAGDFRKFRKDLILQGLTYSVFICNK